MILCAGDITKRDEIEWGFTLDECRPFLKWREREILFREGILAFLGVETKEQKDKAIREKFCKACKKAKLDHCETCNKEFGK